MFKIQFIISFHTLHHMQQLQAALKIVLNGRSGQSEEAANLALKEPKLLVSSLIFLGIVQK